LDDRFQRPARTPTEAYRDTAEGRALIQVRVARFGRLMFLIGAGFYPLGVISRGLTGATGERGLRAAFGASSTYHLIALGLFLFGWLFARRGVRSPAALRLADGVMTVGGAFAFEMMGHGVPAWVRPDLFTLFAVSQLLAIRSAIVPSTARYSVVLAVLAVAPIPVVGYAFYRANPLPEGAPGPLGTALNSVLLCALVVVVAGVLARTVHGLRERVRAAMQLGQYTLNEKIGEGGMGVVYKASHALLRRPTAIKLLPLERAGEHNITRFEREVQLTSMLTHPNTVSVYDFGRTPEGTFYYAMEYLEGLDLQTLVDADGPQEPGRVVHILTQVLGALAEAHAVGLIHRDVKPANLNISERSGTPDVVKVLDFGLVKQLGAPVGPETSASQVNQIIGTPLYLSPEAIIAPSSMDGRADLYALGAVGYFLLTGVPPFTGASVVEVCGHHLHTQPVPPSERLGRALPAELERLILACLAKSAADRPADAKSLKRSLAGVSVRGEWSEERAHDWWQNIGRRIIQQKRDALRESFSEAAS
jgi:serine/threonine-protein kinase